jgi:hypothetical protein
MAASWRSRHDAKVREPPEQADRLASAPPRGRIGPRDDRLGGESALGERLCAVLAPPIEAVHVVLLACCMGRFVLVRPGLAEGDSSVRIEETQPELPGPPAPRVLMNAVHLRPPARPSTAGDADAVFPDQAGRRAPAVALALAPAPPPNGGLPARRRRFVTLGDAVEGRRGMPPPCVPPALSSAGSGLRSRGSSAVGARARK